MSDLDNIIDYVKCRLCGKEIKAPYSKAYQMKNETVCKDCLKPLSIEEYSIEMMKIFNEYENIKLQHKDDEDVARVCQMEQAKIMKLIEAHRNSL